MTNRLGWPLSSPAYDPYKALNLASTAQNTTCQSSKYMNYTPQEGYSEVKNPNGVVESPQVTRRFMEHDPSNNSIGLFSSSLKTIEKSEFKNYSGYNSQYHSFRDLIPQAGDDDQYRSGKTVMTISKLDFNKPLP